MTARVLVVDDMLPNVKLLEAKLSSEYYEVQTAMNGPDALALIDRDPPDIVLLDVMMPGMDGFEVCRAIRTNPVTSHIPVVMVTALDQPQDRLRGLEAGADDFLTKPVRDIALFARVRSLVRLKVMVDELRAREATNSSLGMGTNGTDPELLAGARILLVDDQRRSAQRIEEALLPLGEVVFDEGGAQACELARHSRFDLVIVSLSMETVDGLRICSALRSADETRHLPILTLAEDSDMPRLVRGLDLGVNDYLVRPLDRNELLARSRTQIRRKRYTEKLRESISNSLKMAVTDAVTGLSNRHYIQTHLATLMEQFRTSGKVVSLLMMDIDFFKKVNDTYGHAVGDEVLAEFARRMMSSIRGADLAGRFGGEEFVVVMPDTDLSFGKMVAERLRRQICDVPFPISAEPKNIPVTCSIGVSAAGPDCTTSGKILEHADIALYQAKGAGRNQVVSFDATEPSTQKARA